MLCKRVVTKDRRYITQITCYEKGQNGKANLGKPISRTPMRMPLFGKPGGGVLSSLFSKIGRQGSLPGDFDTTINPGGPFGGINGIDEGNPQLDLNLPSGGI